MVIVASFPLRAPVGMRNWRLLHWATYAVFVLGTAHGLLARLGLVSALGLRPLPRRGRGGRVRDRLPPPRPACRAISPPRSRKEQLMYRVVIDRSLCSGFGTCAELAPDIFELDPGGVVSLRIGRTDDPAVQKAAFECPMGAITVVEEQAASAPGTVVIVGAGLAGARAAETLRAPRVPGQSRARRRGTRAAVRAARALEGIPRRQPRRDLAAPAPAHVLGTSTRSSSCSRTESTRSTRPGVARRRVVDARAEVRRPRARHRRPPAPPRGRTALRRTRASHPRRRAPAARRALAPRHTPRDRRRGPGRRRGRFDGGRAWRPRSRSSRQPPRRSRACSARRSG